MTDPAIRRATITLEQAWHFLMEQFAYRNPSTIFQGKLARKALAQMMTSRSARR